MVQRERMSSVDRAWLRMETTSNRMVITAVFLLQEPMSISELREWVTNEFLQVKRFRQNIIRSSGWLGWEFWEDVPDIDISQHISRIEIPNTNPQQELQDYISTVIPNPLDMNRPLWQMVLVEKAYQESALIIRLHHCIGDGYALVQSLLAMTHSEDDGRTERREGVGKIEKTPSQHQGTDRRTSSVFKKGGRFIMAGWKSILALARLFLRWPDSKSILKKTPQIQKMVAWSDDISLKQVKHIGNTLGSTVNDVIVAATAGALRRYMMQMQSSAQGIHIRATIPVNIRGKTQYGKMGNQFGLVFLPLSVGMQRAKARLASQKRSMDKLKDSMEAFVSYGVLWCIGYAPRYIQKLLIAFIAAKTSLVLSNVRGPSDAVCIGKNRVKNMMFWVPQTANVGLGVSLISYNQTIRIGITSDTKVVSRPEVLIQYFEEELHKLRCG